MATAREKFVAFAFCWADMLIELDQQRKIVFAAGATQPILGKFIEQLIGTSIDDYVAPRDKFLVEQLLGIAAKKGRIDDATIRLQGTKGQTPPLSFAGFILLALGRNEEAVIPLKRAIHLDPNQADAHYNLGEAYQSLGKKSGPLSHSAQPLA